MGWLSEKWKGVKKVFKKIGRGIKKVAMKVGKFMNKIGIVGQIAMSFILPGVANFLLNGLGGVATSMVANTFGGIGGAIVKGAGHVLQAAHKFVTVGKNAFNTVAEGVSGFVTEFGKTALNKIPGINIQSASQNFFGTGGAWETVQKDIVKNYKNILNPFKSTVKMTEGMNLDDLVNSTGVSKARIQEMNVSLDLDNLNVGQEINFDAGIIRRPTPEQLYGGDVYYEGDALMPESIKGRPKPYGKTPVHYEGDPLSEDFLAPQASAADRMRQQFPGLEQAMADAKAPAFQYYEGDAWTPETTSLLSSPNVIDPVTGQAVAKVTEPEGFWGQAWQSGKDEFATVYGDPFQKAPVATTLDALGDIQATAEAFSETEVYQSRGTAYAPMYVSSNAQDYDVRAAGQPRNFGAYSGAGQYGSTARIYDTILMNPISTWSRDLASRFG